MRAAGAAGAPGVAQARVLNPPSVTGTHCACAPPVARQTQALALGADAALARQTSTASASAPAAASSPARAA
ncbi:MAG TPA: hypothetical protein DDX54_03915 [Rhodospirillaceae bacterium]|nr:hypothetical protein [Rhodospirillaceae bacterium]